MQKQYKIVYLHRGVRVTASVFAEDIIHAIDKVPGEVVKVKKKEVK